MIDASVRIGRTATALSAALVLGLFGGSPAHAGVVHQPDRVGDSPRSIDLRWVKYENSDLRVRFTFKFVDLRPSTKAEGFFSTLDYGDMYSVKVGLVRGRTAAVFRSKGIQRRCAGMKAVRQPDRDLVQVSVPRRCFYGPRALRMSGQASNYWQLDPEIEIVRERMVEL